MACLTGCFPTTDEDTATRYRPILMQRADLEKSINVQSPKEIGAAGKIYAYQDLLFINERYRGVHVFNNTDPSNPTAVAFLNIPGNVDISIVDGVIYADNSVDLVALNYSDEAISILSRERNVFPEIVPPDFGLIPTEFLPENRPENTVIVRWEEIEDVD